MKDVSKLASWKKTLKKHDKVLRSDFVLSEIEFEIGTYDLSPSFS